MQEGHTESEINSPTLPRSLSELAGAKEAGCSQTPTHLQSQQHRIQDPQP